jgi:hypothetical protein
MISKPDRACPVEYGVALGVSFKTGIAGGH